MTRNEVYRRIDLERDSQDGKWGGKEHDSKHDIASWLTFMQHYMTEAIKYVTKGQDTATLSTIRKIAALSIACMELYGTDIPYGSPERPWPAPIEYSPYTPTIDLDNSYSKPVTSLK